MAPIISISGLTKHFSVTGGILKREVSRVQVLRGIDLDIEAGEITAIVGESGCGKSTLAKILMKLEKPTGGRVEYSGQEIGTFTGHAAKRYYNRVQMVFQNPYASLNPRLKTGSLIGEMLRIRKVPRKQEKKRVLEALREVGLPADTLHRYPHELSGGQRQRNAIAKSLVIRPEVLIADEPVSALDLSLQAQTLELIGDLKKRHHLTVIMISHDLNTVATFCDRVAVMYLGRIVETLPAESLFTCCAHPYLKAMLKSIPTSDPLERSEAPPPLTGEVPDPAHIPAGCAFHPRCPAKADICKKEVPRLLETGSGSHLVACHQANPLYLQSFN